MLAVFLKSDKKVFKKFKEQLKANAPKAKKAGSDSDSSEEEKPKKNKRAKKESSSDDESEKEAKPTKRQRTSSVSSNGKKRVRADSEVS
jgi:hypothetical protein